MLGTGKNVAWLYDKSGTRAIAPLDNATRLNWGRKKNAISEASLYVATGTHGQCCSVLGSIGTWGHSIVVFRDGRRVWEGPITNIKWQRGGVAIGAHDVLGWSMVKTTHEARLVEAPGYRAVDEMYDDVGRVFSTHDPNVLAHRVVLGPGTGPLVTRDVKAYAGYYDDQLNEMAKGGANYTVVGRRIVLWPDGYLMGRAAPLLPAQHMTGDVEVEENGFDLTTHVTFVNDEGVYGTAPSSAVHGFYGQVERSEAFTGTDSATLAASAETYLQDHFPVPLKVNVPAGSVLSCDAPYSIDELVPGTVIPVKVDTGLCKRVDDTPELTAVEVSDGADGEKVAITLGGTDTSGIEGWMRRVERRQYEHDRRLKG